MLRARKRFGQNFLVDSGVIQKIIGSFNIKPGDHIIEIGPMGGKKGGKLVFAGNPNQLIQENSLTGSFLRKHLAKSQPII